MLLKPLLSAVSRSVKLDPGLLVQTAGKTTTQNATLNWDEIVPSLFYVLQNGVAKS